MNLATREKIEKGTTKIKIQGGVIVGKHTAEYNI